MDAENAPPQRPKAAVLDTCIYDKGHFNAVKVENLALRLSKRSVALWIPLQVVFEWAAHAHIVMEQLSIAHTRAFNAGLVDSQPPVTFSVEKLADELTKRCSAMPNVTVLKMDGAAAAAGIRDQILGTGPGKIVGGVRAGRTAQVGGVRTGASDSSWIRDAVTNACGHPQRIVFITRNATDVQATTGAIGHDADTVRIWNGDLKRFDEFFPPPEGEPKPQIEPVAALHIVARTLHRKCLAALTTDDRSGPPQEWIQVDDVSFSEYPARDSLLLEPYVAMESPARLVDVRNVDVEADGDDTIVRYSVRLLASLRVDHRVFDNDGHALIDTEILRDRLLDVPYSAVIRGEVLHDVSQADTAASWPAAQRFRDGHDAFRWLFDDEISGWDYIAVTLENPGGDPEDGFTMRGLDGQEETATLDGEISSDWRLSFENTGVSIHATYDHGSRVALGRADSFDMYPPVALHAELPGRQRPFFEPYSAFAAIWLYLVLGEDLGSAEAGGRPWLEQPNHGAGSGN